MGREADLERRRPSTVVFRLVRSVHKALTLFEMVAPGERVVVGVSGGKDSLGLVYLLWWHRHLLGMDYELEPVQVVDRADPHPLPQAQDEWFRHLGLHCSVVPADLRTPRQGLSPCFVCTWNRKRALFETAEQLGSPVVALGHHSDDVAVTSLMNLFFQGRFDGILPYQRYFGGKFRLVRPLYFVSERALVRLAREEDLPVEPSSCPFRGSSRREIAREWLEHIVRAHPLAKRNLLGALHRQALTQFHRLRAQDIGSPGDLPKGLASSSSLHSEQTR